MAAAPSARKRNAPRRKLSATGKEANSSRFSGTSDMPARTRASTGVRATSRPWNRTVPPPACTPMMALSSVVLPAPFGPMTVMICPVSTRTETPCSALTPP